MEGKELTQSRILSLEQTNVPDVQLAFRRETLLEKLRIIRENQY